MLDYAILGLLFVVSTLGAIAIAASLGVLYGLPLLVTVPAVYGACLAWFLWATWRA